MSRIGRYEIVRVLGRGGMGVVYLALDPRINRQVALKAIQLPEGLSPSDENQNRERFRREAIAAGKLNHPYIVAVHDVGEDPQSGASYIVMEYVEGPTLKEIIRRGPPPSESDVRRIGAQLAEALDYAHGQGVIHRDIKPANVILARNGQVKITDFGVARLADSELTRQDQAIGSPAYMSPEQIRGEPVGPASDLFSLGVLLYLMATDRRPFDGGDTATVMYKILHEDPPPPSRLVLSGAGKHGRSGKPEDGRTGLSQEFDGIVSRLLSKDSSCRYHSGKELARDLLGKRPLSPNKSGDPEKTELDTWPPHPQRVKGRKFPKRGIAAGVAVLLFLLFLFGGWGGTSGKDQAEKDELSNAWEEALIPEPPRKKDGFWSGILGSPVRGESTVEIWFSHHLPSGSLQVFLDGKEILDRTLKPQQRERTVFGKKVFEHPSETISETISVNPGEHRFEAVVRCSEKDLEVKGETRLYLSPGDAGRLVIDLDRLIGKRLNLKWK